jgi:hypothetical protein
MIINPWFIVYEGSGHESYLAGTESWGTVFAIIEAKDYDSFVKKDASCIFIGFVLDYYKALEIIDAHNSNLGE